MALADGGRPIGFVGEAAGFQHAGPCSEAHGPAQFVDPFQLAKFVDHALGGGGIELGRVGFGESANVARVFDHHGLHAEADAEVGHLFHARVLDRVDHAFDAAPAESAGHENPVEVFQFAFEAALFETLGLDPVNVDFDVVGDAAMQERFLQALVGILILDVLADQRDVDARRADCASGRAWRSSLSDRAGGWHRDADGAG